MHVSSDAIYFFRKGWMRCWSRICKQTPLPSHQCKLPRGRHCLLFRGNSRPHYWLSPSISWWPVFTCPSQRAHWDERLALWPQANHICELPSCFCRSGQEGLSRSFLPSVRCMEVFEIIPSIQKAVVKREGNFAI